MRTLYKFFWDCGRMGELEGLFICEDAEIEALFGKDIYFGEVLGKHSDIHGTLEKSDVTPVIVDQAVIEALENAGLTGTLSGFNPLDYYEPDEEE